MSLAAFLTKIQNNQKVSFQESIDIIATNYTYTPSRFINGNVVNEAGKNEGSCKLFYFAKLHNLSPEQTLSLFGDFYYQDVLTNPEGDNHANIRSFMKQGWAGIQYDGAALTPK